MPGDDLAQDRDLLIAAVRDAGALALTTFQAPVQTWAKGQSSIVCEADYAVDRMLRERLMGGAPGYGWLSEETEDDPARMQAHRIWVVDPIDGTRAYLAGREDWVVSAALVAEGRPILAAVFAPATREFFLATAGGGATLNGAPIAASTGTRLDGATASGPKKLLQWLTELESQVVQTPRIGSLALRLARVAQRQLDVAFASGNSHDWDLAAADLLVHEAGGALTTLAGEQLTYNRTDPVHGGLIAAGRERHTALVGLVRGRLAEFA